MKEMPTEQLLADEEYVYKPDTDSWIVQKKSGNKVLSKKDIKADLPQSPLPEDYGSKPFTKFDSEYEFFIKLVQLVIKAGVPVQEIQALGNTNPFTTIDDVGDMAAKVWTLATVKYHIPREWLIKNLPKKASLKVAYESGWPSQEDSVTWGAAAPNTYSDEATINHDYPKGLRQGDDGEPTLICPQCKSQNIDKESSPAKCKDCGVDFVPKPDRGSDDPTVNDYGQNWFAGPNDLGRSHQHSPADNSWAPAGTEDMDGPSPNVRMSSLEKKAYGVGNFWIDPNGKSYKVPGTHTAWGKRNAEKLNQKFGYDLPLDRTDGHYYTDRLINYGWVRIADTMGNGQFVIDLRDVEAIPPFIDDFIAQHFRANTNIPIWVSGRGTNVVLVYDPFPNIQDAVNKAQHQPKMSSFKSFMHKQSVLNRIAYTVDLWPTVIDDPEIRKHFAERGVDIEQLPLKFPVAVTYTPKDFMWQMGNAYAVYIPSRKTIYVHPHVQWNIARSSIIHELEHVIQEDTGLLPQGQELQQIMRDTPYGMQPWEWSAKFQQVRQLKNKGYSLEDVIKYFEDRGKKTFDETNSLTQDERDQIETLYEMTEDVAPESVVGSLKQAHCGPCSVLKMEALHILIDLYYKDNDLFPEEVLEELSVAATELKIDNFNDILESVITEYLEEKAEEIGDKLPKLKNLLIALKDIAPKLGKEIEIVDKQENVEKKASSNIRDVNGIRVYRNPTPEQAVNLFRKSKDQVLRYIATAEGDIYMWDAYDVEHSKMAEDIGLTDDPNWYDGAGTIISEKQAFERARAFNPVALEPQTASLNKQANPPSRYWIAPDGKEFEVAGIHPAWIDQNHKILQKYGIQTENIDRWEIQHEMLSKGWVRISNEPAGSGFQIEVKNIGNIPSFVDDFIAKNFQDGDVIKIGSGSQGGTEITDPFPSIQKAVNKKLGWSKHASLDEVLDQTTQDAIAAEYGVQYLIPLRFYSEAKSYGQTPDRAFAYAIEEGKREKQQIDPKILAELIDTYFH